MLSAGEEIATSPRIRTDSQALAWLASARLQGRIATEGDRLVVSIFADV